MEKCDVLTSQLAELEAKLVSTQDELTEKNAVIELKETRIARLTDMTRGWKNKHDTVNAQRLQLNTEVQQLNEELVSTANRDFD